MPLTEEDRRLLVAQHEATKIRVALHPTAEDRRVCQPNLIFQDEWATMPQTEESRRLMAACNDWGRRADYERCPMGGVLLTAACRAANWLLLVGTLALVAGCLWALVHSALHATESQLRLSPTARAEQVGPGGWR